MRSKTIVTVALLVICTLATAQTPQDKLAARRIQGKVKVIDAHTLQFEDGTKVNLNGVMGAPDLDQTAMIGDKTYPCGQEAADFLRKLIGDKSVTFLAFGNTLRAPDHISNGIGYVEETMIQDAMIRAGWATSHHSGTELAEIIARENKRGLWRGRFIEPEKWSKGERTLKE